MPQKKIFKPTNTKMITFIYFFLLIYTIAALFWWGLLLHQQNKEIAILKTEILKEEQSALSHQTIFQQKLSEIKQDSKLRDLQYLGEGGAFLLIILLSASFVFNAVRKQIKFTQQQQNFMLSVTHELKSPIAVVRLNIETLLKRKLPEDKKEDILRRTLAETNRLNRLSNNMLLASRFDSQKYELTKTTLNLSQLINKLIEETKSRKIKQLIKQDISPNIIVEGDKLMLQIACSNIIENAIKYAPKDSEISIQLKQQGEQAILDFSDQGTGIPNKEKTKIFNRFYRIGNENTRSSQGTGLGLFLTKKIIQQHKGHIVAKDNFPKGTIFEIKLPGTGTSQKA